MIHTKNIPELLSPAGKMSSAIAAIKAGADAIYLGGKNFSARSASQNFTDDEIEEVINYAALHGVRVYIAVNTLYKNDEILHVVDFVRRMYCAGAYAFILQDVGLAFILRTQFPQIEIHASTQMSVHSLAGAQYMKAMGFTRVVLARELPLHEVKEITAGAGIETEVFIHGALCISYSGQCLMSSLIGGRSGNRGKCAQICRTKFDLLDSNNAIKKSGYLLSPMDMMTLESLPEIVNAGVSSLKIEGRMKNDEYVYAVTSTYRKELGKIRDAITHNAPCAPPDTQDIKELTQVFNRGGGFTPGWICNISNNNMMSTQTPKSSGVCVGVVVQYHAQTQMCTVKFDDDLHPGDGIEIWTTDGNHVGTGISKNIKAGEQLKFPIAGAIFVGNKVYKSYDKILMDRLRNDIVKATPKRTIDGKIFAKAGDKLELVLSDGVHVIQVFGESVQAASNAPMSSDELICQLQKTGNTAFEINFVLADIDEGIFVRKSALNALRRDAIAGLEAVILGDKPQLLEKLCESNKELSGFHNNFDTMHEVHRSCCENAGFCVDFDTIACASKSIAKHPGFCDNFDTMGASPSKFEVKHPTAFVSGSTFNSSPHSLSIQLQSMADIPKKLPQAVSRIYVKYPCFDEIYKMSFDADLVGAKCQGVELFLALPSIMRNSQEHKFEKALPLLESSKIDGYLVSTHGQLFMLQKFGTKKKIMLDFTFNIFNNFAVTHFASSNNLALHGDVGITLSQELNLKEISAICNNVNNHSANESCMHLHKVVTNFEIVVYGRQVLMTSRNCPVGNFVKCKAGHAHENYYLRDSKGVSFPVLTDCNNCVSYVLNSKVLDIVSKFDTIKKAGANAYRLIFTTESTEEISEIIEEYSSLPFHSLNTSPENLPDAASFELDFGQRKGKLLYSNALSCGVGKKRDGTYGHFFRGVE